MPFFCDLAYLAGDVAFLCVHIAIAEFICNKPCQNHIIIDEKLRFFKMWLIFVK